MCAVAGYVWAWIFYSALTRHDSPLLDGITECVPCLAVLERTHPATVRTPEDTPRIYILRHAVLPNSVVELPATYGPHLVGFRYDNS